MVHHCDLGAIQNSSCDMRLEFVGSLFISRKLRMRGIYTPFKYLRWGTTLVVVLFVFTRALKANFKQQDGPLL